MSLEMKVTKGDITEAKTEAIVNAANSGLRMGSGVAGAIKSKGGQEVEADALKKGPIKPGEAIESTAGRLPHKYVIHAAGMGTDLKTSEELVYQTTKNTLILADRLGLRSVAVPAIGTGVGGLDMDKCAENMLKATQELRDQFQFLNEVEFVLFDDASYNVFNDKILKGT